MARKSNTTSTQMDKSSFAVATKCGSCHPGDQGLKYDRNGYRYWDGQKFGYEYAIADGKYTGPIVKNDDGTYSNVKLDGDYGFSVPPNRLVPTANDNMTVAAPWNDSGVVEADCLLCHANVMALPGRIDGNTGFNLAWLDRSATLGAKKFSMVPNATMGWTNLVQCPRGDPGCDLFPQTDYAKNMMPINFPPTMANGLTLGGVSQPALAVAYTDAAGNLKPGLAEVDMGGTLALSLDDTVLQRKPTDMNCQGCHMFPDIKKVGKLWMPGHPQTGAILDAHFGKLGCVDCHPSIDPIASGGTGHNIAKGDVGPTGTIRDDLDYVGMNTCASCHLTGKNGAPDPMQPRSGSVAKANHTSIPPIHFTNIACQTCHVPYIRWAFHPGILMPAMPGVPMPIVADGVYDHATNGTQLIYPVAQFVGDDPLDPSVNAFQFGMTPTPTPPYPTYTGSYKWYPNVRKYKGKLTTYKAPILAWFGDWLSGTPDGNAIIKPLPLRLVRKAVTGSYGQFAEVPTPATFDRVWIKAQLQNLLSATDIDTGTTFVSRPVLTKAGIVYYLDDSGNLQEFESSAVEPHPFGGSHEVVPLASSEPNSAGPLGTGGCSDCHSPSSKFFYAQQLADFNFEGTGPRYIEHYQWMGYSDAQVAQYAGANLTVRQLDGTGTVVSAETGKWTDASGNWVDTQINCGAACVADFSPPKLNRRAIQTVNLTATPPTGYLVAKWIGCTAASGNTCSVTMDASKLVYVQYTQDVYSLTVRLTGTGSGTIASDPTVTPSCVAGFCTFSWPASTPQITLTATADAGSKFSGWSSNCPSASGNTCTVTTSALQSGTIIYATFSL